MKKLSKVLIFIAAIVLSGFAGNELVRYWFDTRALNSTSGFGKVGNCYQHNVLPLNFGLYKYEIDILELYGRYYINGTYYVNDIDDYYTQQQVEDWIAGSRKVFCWHTGVFW